MSKFKIGDRVLHNSSCPSTGFFVYEGQPIVGTVEDVVGIAEGYYTDGYYRIRWNDGKCSTEIEKDISLHSYTYYKDFQERIRERMG